MARLKSQGKIEEDKLPEFPLIPVSKGFCISIEPTVKALVEAVHEAAQLDDNNVLAA